MKIIKFFGIAALLVVAISFAWRFFSERQSIPCPAWLSWLIERDNPFAKVHRAATIVANSGIQKKMIVLDAGCGPGRVTIPVAGMVGPEGRVVAMDIQKDMLSRTQEKVRVENLTNIEFLHAGLGEKKLDQEMFDRVLLVTVLGEIPDREAALKEIFNTLKPNGVLSVTEIISDPHFQRRSTVLRLAEELGFRKKEQFGNGIAYTLNLEKPPSEIP